MQTLKDYINIRYNGDISCFLESEVDNQQWRVNQVTENRQYLDGIHNVLQRKDFKWKGKEIKSTKLILGTADKILNFHDTYMLGKRPTLNGSSNAVDKMSKIYRIGKFNKCLFDIKRQVSRFGDAFLYVYKNEKGNFIPKIISADLGYPVFSEDTDDYIGFIEFYRINSSKIGYYNVYYPNIVISYTDEGGYIHEVNRYNNPFGLPIHFKNYNDYNVKFGRSDLEDLKPIYNQLEDLLSKMIDGVYKLSLNPLGVLCGQPVTNSSIDKDMTGSVINLDGGGSFEFANANMDSNTIKLLFDKLNEQLSIVSSVPSTVLGNSNIANVSEVSLGILFALTDSKALRDTEVIRESIDEMNERILTMLGLDTEEEYIDMVFNYSRIINKTDLVNQLKSLYEMNSISVETIIEKCGLELDVHKEKERLNSEGNDKVIDRINIDKSIVK